MKCRKSTRHYSFIGLKLIPITDPMDFYTGDLLNMTCTVRHVANVSGLTITAGEFRYTCGIGVFSPLDIGYGALATEIEGPNSICTRNETTDFFNLTVFVPVRDQDIPVHSKCYETNFDAGVSTYVASGYNVTKIIGQSEYDNSL